MAVFYKIVPPLTILLLAGCGREEILFTPNGSTMHVPFTKRRVYSIEQVPADIKEEFLEWLNPLRESDKSDLPPELRAGIEKGSSEWRIIKDRSEPWSGGCTSGAHFLEAGETADGWWIFHEAGGDVDWSQLVLIKRMDGILKVEAHPTGIP